MYQFPMGKNNILCCVFSIQHRYRFVNSFFVILSDYD